MREQKDTDFVIPIEGVGDFCYARRTLGDNLKIRSEFVKLLNGVDPEQDNELTGFATIFATHKVLCVSAPDGWDDLSSVSEDAHADAVGVVLSLWDKIKEKQDSFRNRSNGEGKAAGA